MVVVVVVNVISNLLGAIFANESGTLIKLSSVATMLAKVGRFDLSLCQQSNIKVYIDSGQSIGGGSLKKGLASIKQISEKNVYFPPHLPFLFLTSSWLVIKSCCNI